MAPPQRPRKTWRTWLRSVARGKCTAAALLAAGLIAAPGFDPLVLGIAMSGVVVFAIQRAWDYTIPAMMNPVRRIARMRHSPGPAAASPTKWSTAIPPATA